MVSACSIKERKYVMMSKYTVVWICLFDIALG